MKNGADAEEPADCAVCLKDVAFSWPKYTFSMSVENFRVETAEKILLLGESGAGKSTLLSLICGVIQPQKGTVRIADHDLTSMNSSQRDRVRADRIGIIFQMFNLLPYASALDNVLVPLRFSPKRRQRCAHAREEATTLCSALGLPGELISKMPASALSVGQQQRVAVARAMIGHPEIIIADEPTSALDAGSQDEFLSLLFAQLSQSGSTLIMVSHDERLAERFDRIVRLEDVAATKRMADS
ncbi:ABC transporter ATP-binding protein [Ruegeria sp. SCP11]|uniref:ABC transporter ATP-binding protein n=1 Tax=Ruegeria sp. SCP11 TaxID=3141378 RepID=UPI00333B81AC